MALSASAKDYLSRFFPGPPSPLWETDPEFMELFANFALDEVVNQGDLDDAARMMAILAALLGCQGVEEYRVLLPAALRAGITPVQVKEILYQSVAYLGIGRVRPFFSVTNQVLTEQGVALPLKAGDPVYATFCGRVRISEYNKGGYGNLVIIRHDNGLETYYGHLSERMVEPNQWVEAGQIIGLGGSTGRSTGPHLHFETRYYGQSFDPERLIDFKNGLLCRETFLLKKSFFSIYSNAGQDFDDEIANEEQDKKEAAEKAAMKYHRIKSGDTLGAIARKYGTTVTNICRLNGIKSTTTLRIGRSLRVR